MNSETVDAILKEINTHYDIVVDERDVDPDMNSKAYKCTHRDAPEHIDDRDTLQTYMVRGNIIGDTFHLRRILPSGRVYA